MVDSDNISAPSTVNAARAEHWGLLEPLRPYLGPGVDICRPLFTANSLVGFLLFLLIVTWFRNSRAGYAAEPRTPRYQSLLGHGGVHDRVAMYEQMWQEEEEALWDWLDDRIGLPDDLAAAVRGEASEEASAGAGRRESAKRHKSMSQRELEHAIDVTEEKLRTLRKSITTGGKGEE